MDAREGMTAFWRSAHRSTASGQATIALTRALLLHWVIVCRRQMLGEHMHQSRGGAHTQLVADAAQLVVHRGK